MNRTLIEQALPPWSRAVLKVGSNLLAADGGGLTVKHASPLAKFIATSYAQGKEVVLVSSGAVAAGRAMLRERVDGGTNLVARQALAALGQAQLIALWQSLADRPVAQVLLTHEDLRDRRRYLNARARLRELIALGVLPVINENDTVAVDELNLGDNDNLAAIVAALVDADLLLIASDIDALYTADPRRDPTATPIAEVTEITPEILAMAGGSGSDVGTGGMRTKLEAAIKAAAAGIPTALFRGSDVDAITALTEGSLRGTLVHAPGNGMQARKYWLRHAPAAPGHVIIIDAGAALALGTGTASLLPGGIVGTRGEFHRGDMVEIIDASHRVIARGLSQYGSSEIGRVAGHHSREIPELLSYSYGGEVVHRDDMATLAPSRESIL